LWREILQIEIQFKNNWICNEKKRGKNFSITFNHMLDFPPIFPICTQFSHKFSHDNYILSPNYALNAKFCHQMHKLARKSDELIPPAHHIRRSFYWINLYNFFPSFSPLLQLKCDHTWNEEKKQHYTCERGGMREWDTCCECSLDLLWTIDYCSSNSSSSYYLYTQ
jgi:hypothetical protein